MVVLVHLPCPFILPVVTVFSVRADLKLTLVHYGDGEGETTSAYNACYEAAFPIKHYNTVKYSSNFGALCIPKAVRYGWQLPVF